MILLHSINLFLKNLRNSTEKKRKKHNSINSIPSQKSLTVYKMKAIILTLRTKAQVNTT